MFIMILFLFLSSFILFPRCLSDCPSNYNYGLNCTLNCTNCLSGCDISGSCINGSCNTGFYGSGCLQSNLIISQAPTLTPGNCSIIASSDTYKSESNIKPDSYYLVYGSNQSSEPLNYLTWPNNTTMSCNSTQCQAVINIPGGTYYFAVYFSFVDLRYSNPIQSLVSKFSTATCNSSSNTPATVITSTSSKVSTISTTPNTGSTISTISTLLPSTTAQLSNYIVQNLKLSAKSTNFINIIWSQPLISVGVSYQVNIQDIGGPLIVQNTSNLYYNITNLSPGRIYSINVVTIVANPKITASSNINICTSPASDFTVYQVDVRNVDRTSITIMFPIDLTNYTCSTNVYRVATVQSSSSSRTKRAAIATSIPSAAVIAYNDSVFPATSVVIRNLRGDTDYTIYAEIYTNVNGSIQSYYSVKNQQTFGPSDGVIVGIVLGLLLLIIAIIAITILLLCWYRKKKRESYKDRYIEDNAYSLKDNIDNNKPRSYAYWSEIGDKMEPRYLVLNKMEWTDRLLKKEPMVYTNQNYSADGIKFIEEYNSLPVESTYSHMDAEMNYTKNRKQDVFPYDHNRVKLRRRSIKNQSDYINASFIDGYLRKKTYIASQTPFDEDTTNDFWNMIYEQNIGQIVMLNESVNRDISKTAVYWPEMYSKYGSQEVMYGNISVKIICERTYALYDIREFEIKDIGFIVEPQLVTQYQFHSWPQHEIPENSIAFLDFYQAIKADADISNGPLLVHCDTGISQSAVYIAFDILNTQVVHESCVNVYRTVAQLRRSRPNMIRNSKQYMFVYDLLFESLLCAQFLVELNVRKIYKLLHRINPQSGIDYLHEQFALLQTYHMITTCHCPKNKDISFLDSITRSQNLTSIASPTLGSIDLFWNIVFNNKIDVIIDLKTTEDMPYYIQENLHSFNVSINEISTISKCFRKFNVSLYSSNHERPLDVTIYQLGTKWVTDDNVTCEPNHNESGVFIELIHHLLINNPNDRILSHCTNGWSKSGLFLTCFNVAMKMHHSKYVMVYNLVKSMKFYRSEFVTSFDQYRFIYNFLKKLVDMKMSNEPTGESNLHGLLPHGDKLIESLFTHEQTPVLEPEQKQKFAPSTQSLGYREYYHSDNEMDENLIIVHYKVEPISD